MDSLKNEPSLNTNQPDTSNIRKSNKVKIILAALVAFASLAALFVYFLNFTEKYNPTEKTQISTPKSETTNTPNPINVETNEQTSIIDTGKPNLKKYTNPMLKISFTFPENLGEEKVLIKEVDKTIYVYGENMQYDKGQFVQVFNKNPNDSLTQAIEKQFLSGFSKTDCFVKDVKINSSSISQSGYEYKTIGYPAPSDTDEPWFANSDKCPKDYSQTNGISYFMADSKHPEIYLFLSIGQYAIADENTNTAWQDTIEFLD